MNLPRYIYTLENNQVVQLFRGKTKKEQGQALEANIRRLEQDMERKIREQRY